jgi:hypothetical protein
LALLLIVAGCGGGGGGSTPLDTTVDYDISKVIFGTPGVSRTMTGSGPDAGGDVWTINRVITTLITPDPADPCLVDETQQDEVLTLTEDTGNVITSAGPSCYTTAGLIQAVFSLDEAAVPRTYTLLTTGGTLPLTARIGDGGLAGIWDLFEDTNGDRVYNGAGGGDTFIGSSTTNWRLEDQQGRAALVLSGVIRDIFGTQIASETDTYFITPSGIITGFEFKLTLAGGGGSLTLDGTVK